MACRRRIRREGGRQRERERESAGERAGEGESDACRTTLPQASKCKGALSERERGRKEQGTHHYTFRSQKSPIKGKRRFWVCVCIQKDF